MVMDAQPSPQNVGREFVRQYYTLLNKAPDHLHRFYNNSSSFLHAGLDAKSLDATLVIGQKQIHSKIQQLNFRDCHAKISQVDAQATLGNGVVVQVTGELSNDGQPMRRFTQTFVLAAQSPKKYYVHNDIFRYQDVYADDELDDGGERANGEEDAVHQLVATAADAALGLGDSNLVGGAVNNVVTGLVGVSGVHGPHHQQQPQSGLGAPNAQQQPPQPHLYYPSNVINSASVVLNSGYGSVAPPAAQTATTPQTPASAQPLQHQNGLHDAMLKGVPPSVSTSSTTSTISNSQASLALKVGAVSEQAGVVASHLSQVASQHQQQLQSQAPSVNPLGLSSQQQLPLQGQTPATQYQQQLNRHQLNDSDTGKSSLNSKVLGASASHVDTVAAALQNTSLVDRSNVADLDKQQQHKSLPHQQLLSHGPQQQPQQIQKPQSSAVGFSKHQPQSQPPQQPQAPVSLEPKTYANLVKSGVSAGTPMNFASAIQSSLNTHNQSQAGSVAGSAHSHQQQHHQGYNAAASAPFGNNRPQQQRDILSPSPAGAGANNAANGGGMGVGGVSSKYASDRQDDRSGLGGAMSQQRSQHPQRSLRSNGTTGNSMTTGSGGLRQDNRQSSYSRNYSDNDDRRQNTSTQYGDNHQLFLGNIPHHATEEELVTLFSKFGTVIDLRILSKPVQKMPGVRTPPHYGFITYEDPSSVQTCLTNMPLYFPDNSPDGQKLNVEEKKTRARGQGEGSGRLNNGGGLGGNSANANGPRSSGSSAGTGQSRPSGGQGGGTGVNRGTGGSGTGQRSSIAGGGGGGNTGVGGSTGGNRGTGGGATGGYGQRSERGGGNVGNAQRSIGSNNVISNRGFGSGY